MANRFELELGGKQLIIETGRFAKQADGAVTVQLGGTVVLTTAVCSKEPKEDVDFLDLLKADSEVTDKLSAAELDELFSMETHTRNVDYIFRRVDLLD